MFYKDEITTSLSVFIPWKHRDDYKLLMGGSMVMHGIRETTNDLDLDVTPELFDYLVNKHHKEDSIETVNGQRRIELQSIFGEIEVYEGNFKTDSGFELGDIIKMKRHFGREKDFQDIVLIEKFCLNRIYGKRKVE